MRFILLILVVMTLSNESVAQWHKNQVIAHRGAWKKNNLPENSIAALREAIRLGCYGTEFDVWLTADNIPVVNHDPEFQGMPIESSTYQQLLDKKLKNGESIPTLEAYLLEGIKQEQTKLILEMKPSKVSRERSRLLAYKCFALVKKLKATKWVEYISFEAEALREIKQLDSKAITFYLNGDFTAEQLNSEGFTGADYHYSVFQKDESWFEKAKASKLILNAWTVNTEELMRWLLHNKVEFITTNEPELLFDVLKK